MSKEINNREYRQKVIKDLIAQLHAGKTVDEVKQQFQEAFEGVSSFEISAAEQALIAEGVPVEEVQRLCDVHAAVFKGSIEEPKVDLTQLPGHPVNTLKEENSALEELIETRIKPKLKSLSGDKLEGLAEDFDLLGEIDIHYLKKENLMFPYLEKYGITAPPKVMWGVDDEIRGLIKEVSAMLEQDGTDLRLLKEKAETAIEKVTEMIYKEENILVSMLVEHLTQDEWKNIADESYDLGFCLIGDPPRWEPQGEKHPVAGEPAAEEGRIYLPSGSFTVRELTAIMNTLPFDITFVDKNDEVKYFSQGAHRFFPRTTAVLGRKVTNCHPPASMHIVEGIVSDFKSGRKDHEDFWIKKGDYYIYIRYFAVRDEKGEYAGTVEVTQNIAPIQKITGEKRLVSD
ncbi:MAG: DUF438 domain-containing protein [Oscillospiraceae bacterium]|jgi:DUF438 domain-containing protein